MLQFHSNELMDRVLLQYSYHSLDTMNKRMVDKLIRDGIMRQTFEVSSTLLIDMIKITCAWHTRYDKVTPLNMGLTKV